jgi:ATP phosphoribosyltransferase regulatory subunit
VVVHYDPDHLKEALAEVDSREAGICQLSPCNSLESTLNLAREKGISKVIVLMGCTREELEVEG